jgi:hypothetical protein
MTRMFALRICFVVLAFGLAASSLTLTARVSRPAPRQAEEQGGGDPKQSSSATEIDETKSKRKVVTDPDSEPPSAPLRSFKGLGKEFLLDQEQILTSPAKLRFSDIQWLVPLSGITVGLFATDAEYSRHLSHSPSTISRYKTVSDAGVGALIGGAGGMWLLGHVKHNEHWSETGFLAGEAALNSLVEIESLKYSLGRERPYQGNGTGPFFQGGTSFPSEHAAAAWSIAGVIAHEYPSPFMKVMAYGLASLVDYSRIRAHQHFPSDVFVGSITGNLIAQNIYSRNHDPGLGGEAWRSVSQIFRSDGNSTPANRGSPYVPLDSWIYPALDRLIGMGVIDSGFAGLRPWTRSECARLLVEAADRIETGGGEAQAQEVYSVLVSEFKEDLESSGEIENFRTRIESLYTRLDEISGAPLTDGYVFGQTLINDYGRPYQEGFNSIAGFSAWATAGHWVGYIRAEYQHSPSAPPLSQSARDAIAQLLLPIVPSVPQATPLPSVNQLQLLDSYVGLMFSNWQVTFGRQSISWGPGDGGSLTLSNNAQPIDMFRISRVTPVKLPSILGWLGPLRTEFFLGQLTGQQFLLNPSGFVGQFDRSLAPQPFIHGQKLSFKPTRNFEFGFFRTTIYGGPGYPFTWHTFLRSLLSTGNTNPGDPNKPGKRTSGLDFSYRFPGLRNWLTFYADGLVWDQYSPIAYADRSAWRAGLFLSHVPVFPKLDVRVEGLYTDMLVGGKICCGFYYYDATWRSGYTNNGNIMGSWVGRAGQGAQAWTNYWFSARNRLQFYFRHQKVSQEFIPGGGSLTDVGVRTDYSLRSNLSLSVSVQDERWLFPVIQPNAAHDVTASIGIMFEPQKIFRSSQADTVGTPPAKGGRP